VEYGIRNGYTGLFHLWPHDLTVWWDWGAGQAHRAVPL
jgi:hypothetical protein